MTREEAINELNDRIKSAEYVDSDYIDCVSVDAVKIAISALSVPDTNVEDTISRRDAIKNYQIVCRRTNCRECPLHIQVTDTLTDCELELFLHNLPSAKQLPKGEWLRMSDFSEKDDNRYKCSRCGNVVHHNSRMDLYTFNSWCGRCGSDNRRNTERRE